MTNSQLDPVLQHIRKLASVHPIEGRTDPQLLQQFASAGDQAAFAALLQRHGGMVLGVCRQVLHHLHDAEDAFQATFLVLARNANSIRKGSALASWLHGVAYRIAMKAKRDAARRRVKEGQVRSMQSTNLSGDLAWREVQALLHEEIQRLPQAYRSAFVLCFLEGRSRAEVADQLGLKEGTVSSRLARARKQLQERLSARGVALSAALGVSALWDAGGRAAVADSLAKATIQAAAAYVAGKSFAGGILSAKVVHLAEGVTKTMIITKLKLATVLTLALGLSASGAAFLTGQRAAASKTFPEVAGALFQSKPTESSFSRSSEQQEVLDHPQRAVAWFEAERKLAECLNHALLDAPAGNPPLEPALVIKGDTITVSGRVVDPEGKPFSGAAISLGWWYAWAHHPWFPPIVKGFHPSSGASSGPDGRFRFTVTKAEMYATVDDDIDQIGPAFQVVAAAKGYGPSWAWLEHAGKDMTLRLVRDDVPLRGQVFDLQGKPVAGVAVRLEHLLSGTDYLTINRWPGLPESVLTDRDGQFVFTGVGRDREAHLQVYGPSIEMKRIGLKSQVATNAGQGGGAVVKVFAGPTKPIEGTIRAMDTGKPLPGVIVYGGYEAYRGGVRAVTDEHGNYRLLGLPKAGHYALRICPPAAQPYLMRAKNLPDSEGLKTIRADVELRRGIPVRVLLVDKATGQLLRGDVLYTPLSENPLIAEAEQEPGLRPTMEFSQPRTPGKDNATEFLAYPGSGAVFGIVARGRTNYFPAKLDPADREKAAQNFELEFVRFTNAYRIINPRQTDDRTTIELSIDPGRTIEGSLIGPDGKPVAVAVASGLSYAGRMDPTKDRIALATAAFQVTGLAVQQPRTISFTQKERKLLGYAVLKGNEQGPLNVRLQPWGTATGRLVDAKGNPIKDVQICLHYPKFPGAGIQPPEAVYTTDQDGRFQVTGLANGLKHELTLRNAAKSDLTCSAGDKLKNLTVSAGATIDLGDVPVQVVPAKTAKAEGSND
ncbi:MAG TPA: sigma-70 family RNA polymerase sigma factor [Gemmataceae bacterium]|nr:sigma-70 family RNA polymerase sigma factor [Gemmataceae bacterium]